MHVYKQKQLRLHKGFVWCTFIFDATFNAFVCLQFSNISFDSFPNQKTSEF